MTNILIITPGIPSHKFKTGWSVILRDFIESIEDSQITIYSNFFKFGKLKNKLFFKTNSRTNVDILKRRLSLKILFFIFIRVFFHKFSIQESFFSPILDNIFIKEINKADAIILFTTRTTVSLNDQKLSKYIKNKSVTLFILDPLSLAYKKHSNDSNNPILSKLYNFESIRLSKSENNIPKSIKQITLVNKKDLLEFKKNYKSKKCIFHPMKPFISSPKITLSNQYKKSFSEQKIIYILGNFNYKPNYKGLLKTISFLEKNSEQIYKLFKKYNLTIKIAGFSQIKIKDEVNNILKKNFSQELIKMIGELKSLRSLSNNGFASLTSVDTTYGRQTKEFVSINNLMPILKYTNINCSEQFIFNFSDFDSFSKHIEYLMNKENMSDVKQKMINLLNHEKHTYEGFIRDVLIH